MEKEIETIQTIDEEDGKFKVVTTTRTKVKKMNELTYGEQIVSFVDKGEYYEREIISKETLLPLDFMKMSNSIRQQRDQLTSQKETWDEYDRALTRFIPHLKRAKVLVSETDEKSKYMGSTINYKENNKQ